MAGTGPLRRLLASLWQLAGRVGALTARPRVPVMPFAALWTRLLGEERGPAGAAALVAAMEGEYRALCQAQGEVQDRTLRRHLEGNIYPQVAAYRVLCREEEREQALSVVRGLHFATLAGVKRQHERVAALPGVFGFYRLLVPWMLRVQHPASGWDIEWVENSRRRIYARVHRCFYQDVLTAKGVGELIQVYCAGDDHVFGEARSTRIEWTRERTRPRGDPSCDVRYEAPAHQGSTR